MRVSSATLARKNPTDTQPIAKSTLFRVGLILSFAGVIAGIATHGAALLRIALLAAGVVVMIVAFVRWRAQNK
jgi:hypothetical protein